MRLLRAIGWSGAIAAGLGMLSAGGTWFWLSQRLADQEARIQVVKGEIARLDKELGEVATLRGVIAEIVMRNRIVESFVPARGSAAELLDRLARSRTRGTVFTAVVETGAQLQLAGQATSHDDVATLVRGLGQSAYFERPRIVEVRTEPAPRWADHPVRFAIAVGIRGRTGASPAGAVPAPSPGDPK